MSFLANLRRNYARGSLSENEVSADPIEQFHIWLNEALEAEVPEPNAMTVATVDANGQPSARIVLLKNADEHGFVFYTNYDSRKGRDLATNPKAALLFHWVELERQIRIEGAVERTLEAESDAYFVSRPLDSRIGAWASQQSQELNSRSTLVARAVEFAAQFALNPPRPPYWGGYRVNPERIEFWQGRPSRMHDRILYSRDSNGWSIKRLYP